MNQFKRNEISLYITIITFTLLVGLFTGDYISYLKMLGILYGILGIAFGYYKFINFSLEKIFANKKTYTKGSNKTYIVNYKYE